MGHFDSYALARSDIRSARYHWALLRQRGVKPGESRVRRASFHMEARVFFTAFLVVCLKARGMGGNRSGWVGSSRISRHLVELMNMHMLWESQGSVSIMAVESAGSCALSRSHHSTTRTMAYGFTAPAQGMHVQRDELLSPPLFCQVWKLIGHSYHSGLQSTRALDTTLRKWA
jgi:hypothetical protein